MVDETELRRTLAGVFGHLKSHQESLQMLYAEVGSMKRALHELSDGKFVPLYEKHLKELVERTSAAQNDLLFKFDDTIQKLQSGGIF
jgi:hypothetical protein